MGRRIGSACGVGVFRAPIPVRVGVPRRGSAEHPVGRAERRSVGVAAGGCGPGGCGRRLRAVGGARVRVRPGVSGIDRDVGRGDEVFAEVRLPDGGGWGQRVRGAPGVARRGDARRGDGHQAAASRSMAVAVLVAGRVVACRGRVGGAGADRAGGSVGGLDRARRRVWVAGVVGGRRWSPAR